MSSIESRCLQSLLAALASTTFPDVCNPYADCDPAFDTPDASAIRLSNLRNYLTDHAHARIALIGEAAGYRGCRFTGIPFTCEAQLREWNDPRYRTTSLRGDYDERSARCVWHTLFGGRGLSRSSPSAQASASDVIFWNVFPWHPHRPDHPLSNRQPSRAELRAGAEVLKLFLEWKQPMRVIAVGRVAERTLYELDALDALDALDTLDALDAPAIYVRHPSHGGQCAFKSAIHSLLGAMSDER